MSLLPQHTFFKISKEQKSIVLPFPFLQCYNKQKNNSFDYCIGPETLFKVQNKILSFDLISRLEKLKDLRYYFLEK